MSIAAFYYDYYDSQLANGEKLQIIVQRAALNSSDESVRQTDGQPDRRADSHWPSAEPSTDPSAAAATAAAALAVATVADRVQAEQL